VQIAPAVRSSQALVVPADLRARLDAAVEEGRDEAAGWARIHPTGSTRRFRDDALKRLDGPPEGDDAERDLQAVRDAADDRTPDGIRVAQALAKRAAWEAWESLIDEVGRLQGPAQAHRAAQLVQIAADRTNEVNDAAKREHERKRPYEVDRSIEVVVPRPDGNPSFPSGHTSGAYAAALVLATFLPKRRDEILDLAAQVAWSRIYGGVHFPSDVLAGARIASEVVADVLRRDAAGLPPR
jgi:acid phosphatase (class A)